MQSLAMLLIVAIWDAIAAAYCWITVHSMHPGIQRVMMLTPVTLICFALPPLLVNREEAPITIQILACILSASSFKVSTARSPSK